MTGAFRMTTTEAAVGAKHPWTPYKGVWHYTEEWFPDEQHVILRDMTRGQRVDVYARHLLVFAIDVDAYKDGKAAAWEESATGRYLAGIEPYVRRGTAGSMRYLVVMDDREWWPVAGKMPWGEIRSAGVGPSPGSRHPSGDLYEAVDGPDAVQYPDGQVISTNVLVMDDGLLAALETDGARDVGDRVLVAGDADLPDNDGRCYVIAKGLANQQLEASTSPRGTTANAAVTYLKRSDVEGHLVGGLIADAVARLPHTDQDTFEAIWADMDVPADCTWAERDCCAETVFGFPRAELDARAGQNGHNPPQPSTDAGSGDSVEVVQVPDTVPYVFDPVHAHDNQELADACLFAAAGWARFAADAALWLTPDRECWTSHTGDLSPWIISRLADFMPHGISPKRAEADGLDLDSPEVQADITRFTNRVTCRSAGGSAGVAAKMRSRVAVAGIGPVALRLTDLDADPAVIWAGGKAWDIAGSRKKLTEAGLDAGTPHLKTCRYAPDSAVETPLWDAFLAAVWPLEDLRTWALRQLSQAVTGYGDKVFPVLSGMTDTGKTSFVVLVADVLGSYAVTVAPELLTGAGSSSMEYARFELKGARLAFLDESPRTGKIAQSALKALTGGAEIHGRPPYGKPVQFRPSHILVATANPGSDPPLSDPAVRGRIRLIGCGGDVAKVRKARTALGPLDGAAWRKEAPGVLARLITVAADVLADPALVRDEKAPAVITALTEQMAAAQDTVALWLAEETESWKAGTRGGELHESYVAWCKRHDDARPESQVEWGRRMSKLGVPSKKSHNVTSYLVKARYRSYDSYR